MANKLLKRRMRAAGLRATTADVKDYPWHKYSKAEKREMVKNAKYEFEHMSGQDKQNARIDTAFNNTHAKLVPQSGPAPTKAGEAVRATMRVAYRSYNDGDVWNKGYGKETVNPSVRYLTGINNFGMKEAVSNLKAEASGGWTEGYKQSIIDLEKATMRYASPKGGKRKEANTKDSR